MDDYPGASPERRLMIEKAKKLCPSAVEDIVGGHWFHACQHLLAALERSAKRAKLDVDAAKTEDGEVTVYLWGRLKVQPEPR